MGISRRIKKSKKMSWGNSRSLRSDKKKLQKHRQESVNVANDLTIPSGIRKQARKSAKLSSEHIKEIDKRLKK